MDDTGLEDPIRPINHGRRTAVIIKQRSLNPDTKIPNRFILVNAIGNL